MPPANNIFLEFQAHCKGSPDATPPACTDCANAFKRFQTTDDRVCMYDEVCNKGRELLIRYRQALRKIG